VDGNWDEATLELLEQEIERAEEALDDLRRRTRTLEVEVATRPPPRGVKGPRQIAAARRRGPVFAWGCVGALIAAFVLLVLAG
jgi:hypothetical protein